ncbi:hypothetical protein ACFW2Y_10170 [Streptomyces sp. NPDC058877]|uniref:hypothetical protein n=1 Tax=unclassified Streptomyces TaxID=2593676 RepID=UPI0036BDAA8C
MSGLPPPTAPSPVRPELLRTAPATGGEADVLRVEGKQGVDEPRRAGAGVTSVRVRAACDDVPIPDDLRDVRAADAAHGPSVGAPRTALHDD